MSCDCEKCQINSDHTGCILHGHCMFPIGHAFHKYCPMNNKNGSYQEIRKLKRFTVTRKELETVERAIDHAKKEKMSASYRDLLINNLEKLKKCY